MSKRVGWLEFMAFRYASLRRGREKEMRGKGNNGRERRKVVGKRKNKNLASRSTNGAKIIIKLTNSEIASQLVKFTERHDPDDDAGIKSHRLIAATRRW